MADCCTGKEERYKKVPRSEDEKKSLARRLNRIEGQIRGIRSMVESERYCVDVLMQVSAVQSALNAFNRELLGSHIRSCVADNIRSGSDTAVDELIELLRSTMR